MDPIEKQERKREARRRLGAQRRRAGELRGRVIAISLISFVLLWGVVFAQMATGNDPVLGDSSSKTTASHRGGGSRRSTPKAIPPEAETDTDSEEAEEPEFVEPEPVEVETIEPEAIEPEPVETEVLEPEPEPAPVITSQS